MKRLLSILLLLAIAPDLFGATANSILTAGVDYPAFNGALGTPTSGTLTNCTGLPLTSVTGFGTGVATAAAVTANASSGIVVSNSSGDINAGRRLTIASDATAYLYSPFAGAIGVTNPSTTFWFVSTLVQINSDTGGFGFGVSTDAYVRRGGAASVVMIEGGSSVGGTMRFASLTPSQITSNQNNYNPGGRSYFQRWSTDASRNVTGLVFASAGLDGEEHEIWNVGSQNIVLVNESASSTAANRFTNTTGADITLAANQMAKVTYDGTTSRWRLKP